MTTARRLDPDRKSLHHNPHVEVTPFKRARIAQVARDNPDMETELLAERFGLSPQRISDVLYEVGLGGRVQRNSMWKAGRQAMAPNVIVYTKAGRWRG